MPWTRFTSYSLLILTGWLGLGFGLVPAVLERALDGAEVPVLSAVLAAHPEVTLRFLLDEWYGIVLAGAGAILFVAGLAHVVRRPSFAQRLVGEATPADIGAIRVVVCAVLLMSVLWEDLASTVALPREMIRPMGVIQILHMLPGFDAFLASEFALALFEWTAAALLFLGMVGWKTRLVLPSAAVAYLVLGGLLRQYAWFYHTGLLPLYLLTVLSLLPSHHGCSLDRLSRIWKGQAVPPGSATFRYGWMRYALWATLALPYVAAGFSKLRNGGLTWWEASNFKFILYQSSLRPMEFDFDVSLLLTSAPDAVFEVMAITAVAGEILYGLVLFSRRARWILPATMVLMHVGILFLQNILFFDLIILQAIYFNFRPALARMRAATLRRWGRLAVRYDDAHAPHHRLTRLLSSLDVLDRLDLQPVGKAGRITVEVHGHILTRGSAYRRIAQNLPALWPILPLLYIPAIGRGIERLLVQSMRMHQRTASPAASSDRRPPATRWRRLVAGPHLTLGLTAVLCFFWVFRVEFYPFTGMQMFSKKRTEPVTYETVWAHLESGEIVRAPVEGCIGAMSDSRYRRVVEMAFASEKGAVTEEFLESCRARWNARVSDARERIERFEVQQWEWYFLREPESQSYGEMIDRRVFPASDPDGADTTPASSAR